MADDQRLPGEEASLEILRERTHAWWMAVVAGQTDQSHPAHGTDVNAHVEGDTLVITGKVPSKRDRQEIQREADHLKGQGIARVRNELRVVPLSTDRRGLLVQTLISAFETAEQAGFAAGYLEGHAGVAPSLMRVVAPEDADVGRAALRSILPAAFWEDGERALQAGRALLIVTVDELDAFKARELLEEETRSLLTLVLPPEPARNVDEAQRALDRAAPVADDTSHERGDAARRRARMTEQVLHDS